MTINTFLGETTISFSGNLMVDGHHLMGEIEEFIMNAEGDLVIDITGVTELGIQGLGIVSSMWKHAPYGCGVTIRAGRHHAPLFKMIRIRAEIIAV